ncbi:MAG: ABC transporter substrate-binding protein [Candidatus Rifleibacteriota bacterium]
MSSQKIIRREGSLNIFRLICIVLFSILAFVSPTFASSSTTQNVPIYDQVTLKLKWKHQFQFAGYYAAVEKGFYKNAGLKVNIEELDENENSFSAVLEGKAHFGIANSDLLVKRAQGEPVVALAAIYQHSPMVLLTKSSSNIKNIHQLAGKRVMIEEHSAELKAYLKSEKIEESEMILYPHSYGVKALINDEVDVISAYNNDEPFLLKKNGIDYRVFIPQSSGIDFYSDILYTTEHQVKNYPQRVKKFVEATKKGWRYALANPEEITDLILNKYSKRHSREHLLFEAEGAKKLIRPAVIEIGYMNHGRWQHIKERYKSLGMINKEIDLNQFLYSQKHKKQSLLVTIIQIMELLAVILAVFFVIKYIKAISSIDELNTKNRRMRKKLTKSRRRFAEMLQDLPGMAYRCKYDENWTMEYISKGCFELTGYYPDELKRNKLVAYQDLIVPEDRDKVFEAVKNSFHKSEHFKTTYRIKCKDSTIKWVWEQGRFISSSSATQNYQIAGFITDVTESKTLEQEREKLIEELKQAITEIKTLKGILPICSSCKKIRDDKGYWEKLENYIKLNSDAEFSHGLCPDCLKELYPEIDMDETKSKED